MDNAIKFGKFLNLDAIEISLATRYKSSLKKGDLEFDLTDVEWFSPFTLSLLWCWIFQCKTAGCKVRLFSPQHDSLAAYFFRTVDLPGKLRSEGVLVEKDSPEGKTLRIGKLAAFDVFKSKRECDAYLDSLADEDQQAALLNTNDFPDIVRTGHFASIVLAELTDNTFTHGRGLNSHYLAFEADRAVAGHRKPHPIFTDFHGEPYVEICVGDSSNRSIVQTLQDQVLPNYQPDIEVGKQHKFTEAERTLLYAFEYGSTSNPQARLNKIQAFLDSQAENPAEIETGLYSNLSLARLYKGQLIVRAGGLIASIDCSGVATRPRAAFRLLAGPERLVTLKGSTVVLRVPVRLSSSGKQVAPLAPVGIRTAVPVRISVISPPSMSEPSFDAKILPYIETEISKGGSERKAPLIACCLDGLRGPTMVLPGLLSLLAKIPRHGKGLFVTLDDLEQLRIAREHYSKLGDLQRNQGGLPSRDPSMVVAVSKENAATLYGSYEHPEATYIHEGKIKLPGGALTDLGQCIKTTREKRLQKELKRDGVRHSGHHYLIFKSYYTTTFYEVPRITHDPAVRATLNLWLAGVIQDISPKVIVYTAPFLEPVLEACLSTISDEQRPALIAAFGDKVASTVLEVLKTSKVNNKVLILIDVICTGRFLMQFTRAYPRPEELVVLALIDARPQGTKYYAVSTPGGSVDIPLHSIMKDPLEPIKDRPPNVSASEIFVIDPLTHAPTQYPTPVVEHESEREVLEKLSVQKAFSAGHYSLREKHYVYFLPFKRAFVALGEKIEAWLKQEAVFLRTTSGIDLSETHIFCLDEDTGLYQLVERATRGSGINGITILNRENLLAPPTCRKTTGTAWFVIPAMASGNTVHQCLEYGPSTGARSVLVSVVLPRVEPKVLLFYQNLTGYREKTTWVHFMFHLPLISYTEETCPICRRVETVKRRIPDVRLQNRLETLFRSTLERESVVYLTSAGGGEVRRDPEFDSVIAREMYLMALYYRSKWDIGARRTLKHEIEDQDNVECLATGAGRASHQNEFRPADVEDRIYHINSLNSLSSTCKNWALKQHKIPRLFALQLRGFSVLCPGALRDHLGELIAKSIGHRAIYEILLTEACLQPELFWDALDDSPKPQDPESLELYTELVEFVRRNGTGLASEGLFKLHELREHLHRSRSWGNTIQSLIASINDPNSSREEIDTNLSAFMNQGFKEGQTLYSYLRRTLLWPQLKIYLPVIDTAWADFCDAVREFETHLKFENRESMEELRRYRETLEQKKRIFLQVIDRIAVRPGPVLEELRKLAPSEAVSSAQIFDIEVADDCPSIAMLREDFITCMQNLLANAHFHGNTDPNKTRFRFVSHRGAFSKVLLEVYQTSSWKKSERLEGGLYDVRTRLQIYGASMKIVKKFQVNQPFLLIKFLSWPIYQSNDIEEAVGGAQ